MSNVIGLRELVRKLSSMDLIYINNTPYWYPLLNADSADLVASDPLVHIELVEEDYEDGPEDGRHNRYTVYVTIV